MTDKRKRKITEEQYKKAIMANDTSDLFYPQELFGYGVYDVTLIVENGEHFVTFRLGGGCD